MFCCYKQNAYLCRRIQLVNSATKVQNNPEKRAKTEKFNNKNKEYVTERV